MSRRNARALSPSEEALWKAVKATVTPMAPTPLSPTPSLTASLSQSSLAPQGEQAGPGTLKPNRRSHVASPQKAIKQKRTAKKQPPASPLLEGDPGVAKRVARGRLPIAATLDLHGMTQREAESRLAHFIEFAAARGDRTLLVITGKGRPTDQRAQNGLFENAPRGILRQRFLEWIETPPLRHRIASVKSAHQKHGGRGAFYVFLRRDT